MVAECNLTPDEFWGLSLYEWSLYLHRYKVQTEKEVEKQNDFWRGLSVIWAVLMNGLFRSTKQYKPSDLIVLDGNIDAKIESKPDGEDLLERVKRLNGATLQRKKKHGGKH